MVVSVLDETINVYISVWNFSTIHGIVTLKECFIYLNFQKEKKKYIRFYGYESNVEYATIVRTQNYNLLGYVRAITEQF